MKLIFLLQKDAWFVEHEQAWYRVNDEDSVHLALTGLALNVANQHEIIEQPHMAGSARLEQDSDKSIKVTLVAPDDTVVATQTISLDEYALASVDWRTKQFRDGWMSSTSLVTLDNVGELQVDAYLPAKPGCKGKKLTVSNLETGDITELWLGRDEKTRLSLLERGHAGKVELQIECEPEAIDQSTDPRQLGFVMIAEQIRPA